jgi:acetoin utilization deacetylase AcuC-like enzyme
MEKIDLPQVHTHGPDLIVVACGYDVSKFDPLGNMISLSSHFRKMAEMLMQTAVEPCGGKLALSHEGGHAEAYVPFCGAAVIEGLLGIDTVVYDGFAGSDDVDWQKLQPYQQQMIDAVLDAT